MNNEKKNLGYLKQCLFYGVIVFVLIFVLSHDLFKSISLMIGFILLQVFTHFAVKGQIFAYKKFSEKVDDLTEQVTDKLHSGVKMNDNINFRTGNPNDLNYSEFDEDGNYRMK